MDEWMNGLTGKWIPSSIRQSTELSMQYTKRRNLNRGCMKLEVWHRALDLFELAYRLAESVADFKLKSQFTDATQSISANMAEGYADEPSPSTFSSSTLPKGPRPRPSRGQRVFGESNS